MKMLLFTHINIRHVYNSEGENVQAKELGIIAVHPFSINTVEQLKDLNGSIIGSTVYIDHGRYIEVAEEMTDVIHMVEAADAEDKEQNSHVPPF